MQRKSEPPERVAAEGKDLPDFMLLVNSPELKELLIRDKYFGRKAKNSVQLDETIVKLFQDAFKIDIETFRRHFYSSM